MNDLFVADERMELKSVSQAIAFEFFWGPWIISCQIYFFQLILFSPYAPWEGAWARKPNSGMLEAGRQLMDAASSNADFASIKLLYDAEWVERPDESTSFMVGDRGVDMAAAENFGVRGIRCDPDIGISGVVDSILGGVA